MGIVVYSKYSNLLYFNDNFRNTGLILAVVATTMSVMIPPKATEGTSPMNLAAMPDSKTPSSLEDPIKMHLGCKYSNLREKKDIPIKIMDNANT